MPFQSSPRRSLPSISPPSHSSFIRPYPSTSSAILSTHILELVSSYITALPARSILSLSLELGLDPFTLVLSLGIMIVRTVKRRGFFSLIDGVEEQRHVIAVVQMQRFRS